jgi:hypothetical protein
LYGLWLDDGAIVRELCAEFTERTATDFACGSQFLSASLRSSDPETVRILESAAEQAGCQLEIRTVEDVMRSLARRKRGRFATSRHQVAIVCDAHGASHLAIEGPKKSFFTVFETRAHADEIRSILDAHFPLRDRSLVRIPVQLYGERLAARALVPELTAAGFEVEIASSMLENSAVEATIAHLATTTIAQYPLRSDQAKERLGVKNRKLTLTLLAGSVAILVGTLGIQRARIGSRLAEVDRRLADIHAMVDSATSALDDEGTSRSALATLAHYENGALRRTRALESIALALPQTVRLSALSINGNTLTVEGEGASNATVYSAASKLTALRNVQISRPPVTDATSPSDRFVVTASLAEKPK